MPRRKEEPAVGKARRPIARATLASIQKAFAAIGAELRISDGRRLIVCDLSRVGGRGRRLPPALWPHLRKLVYFLFNHMEASHRVVTRGVPHCLFPDAEDHVLFGLPASPRARKPAACALCRFAADCPGMPSRLLGTVPAPAPVPDIPKEIVIEVSKDCNLDCKICFAGKASARPTFPDIQRLIDEARAVGIKSIRFSGGEPLLRPDILRILGYAKKRGFYVILNTNATLLDARTLKALPALVDNTLISLQGCDPASDRDLTRSALPFAAKLEQIARVVASGIGVVRLGTVISRLVLARFQSYADIVTRLGIAQWELYRPMLDRGTLARNPEFGVSAQDCVRLCGRLYELKRLGVNTQLANAFPACLLAQERMRNSVLMGALADEGHSRLIFDSRGFFKPSYFIQKDLGTDIIRAWRHPFLKRLRSLAYLPAACRRCRELAWCQGGSRFWARQACGDYFRRDPWMPSR